VIFLSILHQSHTPLSDARELGLGPEYLPYVDYWPQHPSDDPLANPEWRALFLKRATYGRIAGFYSRHPWRALATVYRALKDKAARRPNLGNYERRSGFPPGTQAKSFGWWSALRSALFRLAPWHIAAWYAGILAIGIRLVFAPSTVPRRISLFAIVLAAMGLVELAISTLADIGETERHLLLFNLITDFSVLLAIAWVLSNGKITLARSRTSNRIEDTSV
jgi:hypothetical protein